LKTTAICDIKYRGKQAVLILISIAIVGVTVAVIPMAAAQHVVAESSQ